MLILRRKEDQSFMIQAGGAEILICFLGMDDSGREGKIGIDAPRHIKIDRTEVYEARIFAEQDAG